MIPLHDSDTLTRDRLLQFTTSHFTFFTLVLDGRLPHTGRGSEEVQFRTYSLGNTCVCSRCRPNSLPRFVQLQAGTLACMRAAIQSASPAACDALRQYVGVLSARHL